MQRNQKTPKKTGVPKKFIAQKEKKNGVHDLFLLTDFGSLDLGFLLYYYGGVN